MFQIISMIGLGYIGLPTATLFASRQKKVIGVDVSQRVVDTVNQGKIHIIEPDLDMLVHAAVTAGFLRATIKPEPSDAFLIAVPTPFMDGHKPDLRYIESAAKSIAIVLKKGDLVILESTSPVGTTEKMAAWLAEARPDLTFPQHLGDDADVQVAHCPERVLPGKVVLELVENDRVIGGMTKKATAMAMSLYKIFVKGELVATDARTAEMCKLTENSFRDVNIAFANELSMICDKLDINVWELIQLANRHPRVGILQPGAGVGGHCIAVDPWFIVDSAPQESRIIRTAREVNDHKPQWILEKVKAAITDVLSSHPKKTISQVKVACLGLAFKPDIDDLRESPALAIAHQVSKLGCQTLVVEPNVDSGDEHVDLGDLKLSSVESCLTVDNGGADIICILVKHRQFVELTSTIKQHPKVIDAVGLI